MQLDDQTANAVTVRPTAAAAGAQRWFRARDLGGGITGTTMEADYLNDHLGTVIAILAAGNVTRTKGAAGDADMLDAIVNIIGASTPATLVGQFKRTSPSVIQLQPSNGVDVVCAINKKQLYNTGAISFDMASDLEQSEAASKALYLYLRESPADTLDPQISETAPDLPGGTKPGYKNGDATRRCVGSTWNDTGQNLIECSWGPGGVVTFHSHDSDHEIAMAHTQAGWASQAVNLPLCASALRLLWYADGTNDNAALAADDAATNPTVAGKIIGSNAAEILAAYTGDGSSNPSQCIQVIIPVSNPASPAFKMTTYGTTVSTENDAAILGYTCLFAPR